MSGRKSREKGRRAELALVHLFQSAGFSAEKLHALGTSEATLVCRCLDAI